MNEHNLGNWKITASNETIRKTLDGTKRSACGRCRARSSYIYVAFRQLCARTEQNLGNLSFGATHFTEACVCRPGRRGRILCCLNASPHIGRRWIWWTKCLNRIPVSCTVHTGSPSFRDLTAPPHPPPSLSVSLWPPVNNFKRIEGNVLRVIQLWLWASMI